MEIAKDTILYMKGITKRFPGTLALDKVDLEVKKGEVHVLLGENGAGKSTLIKILAGAYTKDEGEIYIEGKKVELEGPAHATRLGIAVIYQEFNLVPHLSIAENIFLGREPVKRIGKFELIDWDKMVNDSYSLLKELEIEIDPRKKVRGLSVAIQQMTEIAKALSVNAKIIVMDEPTSALTPAEIKQLFKIIKKLKEKGVSVIFISHHLEEVKEIGDRVTVLRDGKLVGTVNAKDVTIDDLIKMMVGRTLKDKFPKVKVKRGKETLRVENLSRKGILHNISFSLYEGEILGVAGLVGAGRTEMARAIFGADPKDTGKIYVYGEEKQINSPRDAIAAGIGFLTENRKEEGLVLSMNVKENISMAALPNMLRGIFIDHQLETRTAEQYVNDLRIKTPTIKKLVAELSGGNQQKVVLAKWLASQSRILIFDEPTRGIDVGAKVEVYQLMNELLKQGVAILMISSELPEILGMSDRILVMCKGRITADLPRESADQETIMKYATLYADEEFVAS